MTRYRVKPGVTIDVERAPAVPSGVAWVRLASGARVWLPGLVLSACFEPEPVAPPPAPVPLPATEYGMCFYGEEPLGMYRDTSAAGARWALVRWLWTGADLPGDAAWAWPDQMISAARGAGLKVLFRWWWWAPEATHYVDNSSATPEQCAALAGILARRYGARVDAWQESNEPDLARVPTADAVARLAAVAGAIRAAWPGAVVLAPALAWYRPTVAARTMAAQVGSVVRQAGLVPAVHYYPAMHPEGFAAKLAGLRAAMGLADTVPVWVTECGEHVGKGQAVQAAAVKRAMTEARAAGCPVCLVYRAQAGSGDTYDHGLWSPDGTPRPALAAFTEAVRA